MALLHDWSHSHQPKDAEKDVPLNDPNHMDLKNAITCNNGSSEKDEESSKKEDLLCGWNHSKSTKDELLVGWKHHDQDMTDTRSQPPERAESSASFSSSDSSSSMGEVGPFEQETETTEKASIFSQLGSSLSSLMYVEQPEKRHPKSALSNHSGYQEKQGLGLYRGNNDDNSSDSEEEEEKEPKSHNQKQEKEDGVVSYMGRQYSARDLYQRCQPKTTGTTTSTKNRASLKEMPKHDLRSFLSRGFSVRSTKEDEHDTASISSFHSSLTATRYGQQQPKKKASRRSLLQDADSDDDEGDASMHSAPHRTSHKTLRQRADKLTEARNAQLQNVDLQALKATLKKNGAITNGVLQQGLHYFVHQQQQEALLQQRQQRSEREGVRPEQIE